MLRAPMMGDKVAAEMAKIASSKEHSELFRKSCCECERCGAECLCEKCANDCQRCDAPIVANIIQEMIKISSRLDGLGYSQSSGMVLVALGALDSNDISDEEMAHLIQVINPYAKKDPNLMRALKDFYFENKAQKETPPEHVIGEGIVGEEDPTVPAEPDAGPSSLHQRFPKYPDISYLSGIEETEGERIKAIDAAREAREAAAKAEQERRDAEARAPLQGIEPVGEHGGSAGSEEATTPPPGRVRQAIKMLDIWMKKFAGPEDKILDMFSPPEEEDDFEDEEDDSEDDELPF